MLALSGFSVDQLPILARVCTMLAVFLVVPALSRRIGVPGSAGLIICGVIFGKGGLDVVPKETSALPALAEVGKLLILFFAGLEIDLLQFKQNARSYAVFGGATFLFPLLAGLGLGMGLGYSLIASLLIGALLASHTPLGFPIVEKLGLASRPAIGAVIGATLFTDFLSLFVLEICLSLHREGLSVRLLGLQVFQMAIYCLIVLFGFGRLARWLVRRFSQEEEIQLLVLLLMILVAAICAELLHMEQIVGAFLAGVAANRALMGTTAKHHVEVIGNTFFVPAFFVTIGLMLDVPELVRASREHWPLFSGIVVALLVAKLAAAWLGGAVGRFSRDERLLTWSLSIPQVAATLAAALAGYAAVNSAGVRLIDMPVIHAVLVLVLVTSILGPILTQRYGRRVVAEFAPPRHTETAIDTDSATPVA
jgi:Kef-type K+ transport system membrane component KefB